MKIFLTGDRSMDAVVSIAAAVALLNRAQEQWTGLGQLEFVTGDRKTGLEPAVRYLLQTSGYGVTVLDGADAHADLDTYHALVKDEVDAVAAVHTAPFESKIIQSVLRTWGDDEERVLLVTS